MKNFLVTLSSYLHMKGTFPKGTYPNTISVILPYPKRPSNPLSVETSLGSFLVSK